jgi:D-alanyl-lipoteichoic acid acyltransferase DltB (MBOAT superfamily)
MKSQSDFVALGTLIVTFGLYPILAYLALSVREKKAREIAFTISNLVGAFAFCFLNHLKYTGPLKASDVTDRLKPLVPGLVVYFLAVYLCYWLLQRSLKRDDVWKPIGLWGPLSLLIVAKYFPAVGGLFLPGRLVDHLTHFTLWFVGVSYLSFRLCLLAREVQNGIVQPPSFARYLSFAFFVPTLSMGPISPYSRFAKSLDNPPNRTEAPIGRCVGRFLVGLVKYTLLTAVAGNLAYSGLLLDGHPHGVLDLFIAIPAFALYLFYNFSGYCDMVIGVSGLLGIDVMENFDRPFISRNFQEFWTRWHISLSLWFREMMFTPMVKVLTRKYGPKNGVHVIAFSIVSVFVVLGIWHGAYLHFAIFGLSQGLGVAVVHYSSFYLKKRLGPQGFQKYKENKLYLALGQAATFAYFAITLFLFANDFDQIHGIEKALSKPAAQIENSAMAPKANERLVLRGSSADHSGGAPRL